MVIAMASVASAGHKAGHSPGGGGGAATLGDLNCTTDQIAKFNGGSGAWECAFDEVDDGIIGAPFVVVDSTGQIMRHTSIGFGLRGQTNSLPVISSAIVGVDVQYLGETVQVFREVSRNGILPKNITDILYESFDCSGQPFIVPVSPGSAISTMVPSRKQIQIIIDPFAAGGPNPDARLIFFIDFDQLTEITHNRRLDNGGDCGIYKGTEWAVPIIDSQFTDFRDDFHILFPPPYRICAADDIDCIIGP